MPELKKIAIVVFRIQAIILLFMGMIQWMGIAFMLVMAMLNSTPSQLENFEYSLFIGALYFLLGLIMWFASSPLAALVTPSDNEK